MPKINIRATPEYKRMEPFVAVGIAEGWDTGREPTKLEVLAAWQYLHDSRLAYSLQGWFGDTAQDWIGRGLIAP